MCRGKVTEAVEDAIAMKAEDVDQADGMAPNMLIIVGTV